MKQLYYLLLALFPLVVLPIGQLSAQASNPDPVDPAKAFITRWQCEEGQTLKVRLSGAYSYRWVQLDTEGKPVPGTEVNGAVSEDEDLILTATAAGKWKLLAGPRGVWRFTTWGASNAMKQALLQVEQWGTVRWTNMSRAFEGCSNLTLAEGAGVPDLSYVEDISNMFKGCTSFNQPIGAWDVSNVRDMQEMFSGCSSFNQPIGDWDVSDVRWMEEMFSGCSSFNQPIGGWDVSSVKDMKGMFKGCTSFNQPIGGWNVSNVEDMSAMFEGCSSFNQPIGEWDVFNVKLMGATWGGMFSGCTSFNQPIGGWNVSNVTNMQGMFSGCTSFNQPIGNWDVSRVTDMERMFSGCTSFNHPIGGWDVSNVKDMYGMFSGCSSFNQPIGGWNVSNVRYMNEIFSDCTSFNQPIGEWRLWLDDLFGKKLGLARCGMSMENYSATLVAWAQKRNGMAGEVKVDADGLFYSPEGSEARRILIEKKGWVFTGDRLDAQFALDPATAFITRWQCQAGQKLEIPLYGEYFYRWVQLDQGGKPIPDTEVNGLKEKVNDRLILTATAEGPWQLQAGPSGVMRLCMGDASELAQQMLQVEQWGAAQWFSMKSSFSGCSNLTFAEGAGTPDLSRVKDMSSMFFGCTSFNQPIGNWNVSQVTDMNYLFLGCSSFNQPLESWDVAQVTDMGGMFSGCTSFNQPIGNWNVSSVTNMKGMFFHCSAFNQPIGAWDVSWVQDMGGMFSDCASFNQPIGEWKVSRVRDMSEMLDGCVSFNQPLAAWTPASLEGSLGLKECGLSMANYSAALTAWAERRDQLRENVSVEAHNLFYNAQGATARKVLTDSKHWRFTGDREGKAPSQVEIVAPPAQVEIGVGATFTARVLPEGASQRVVWSVQEGEASGASFEGNVLTATKAGRITVRAEALDDPKPYAVATVVVAKKRIPLQGIAFAQQTMELIGQGTADAPALIYTPQDASNKRVVWSSSDPTVASVDDRGRVKGIKAGTATITATAEDGGHAARCTVTVKAEGITSAESALLAGLFVGPNPFGDRLVVYQAEGVLRYELMNASGAVVLRGAHDGGAELSLQTAHLERGMYWLRLVAHDGERVVGVVKD